jgi:hypothetical protein
MGHPLSIEDSAKSWPEFWGLGHRRLTYLSLTFKFTITNFGRILRTPQTPNANLANNIVPAKKQLASKLLSFRPAPLNRTKRAR